MPYIKPSNPSVVNMPVVERFLHDLLTSPTGVLKLTFPTTQDSYSFRQKCYTIRGKYRKQSRKIYDDNHPKYDRSPWDFMQIDVRESTVVLRLEPILPSVIRVSTQDFDEEENEGQEEDGGQDE